MTMVHFLADIILQKYPEINGFEDELSHASDAARGKKIPKISNKMDSLFGLDLSLIFGIY